MTSKRTIASLVSFGTLALATATCTQLLGVESAEPVPEGGPLPTCSDGRESCGGELCDTDITTDPANCGACGAGCIGSNASAACVSGKCQLECTATYADCNNNGSDGCEVFLQTDVHNCGACGHDCRGTPCADGVCLPVIIGSTTGSANAIELDSTFAYVSTGQSIQTLPLSGGNTEVAFDESAVSVPLLSYAAPFLYAELVNGSGVAEIDALSRNGLHKACVSSIGNSGLTRLAADDAGIVWASNTVLDGGIALLSTTPTDTICDAGAPPGSLAVVTNSEAAKSFVLDGSTIFVAALDTAGSTAGPLFSVDRATGAFTVILPRIRPALGRSLAVDDTYVYWIDSQAFVRRVPKGGCPTLSPCTEDVYFEQFGSVFAIAVDDNNLYALGTNNVAAYLEIIDKKNTAMQRNLPSDQNVTSGDVNWNQDYVVWGLGQKVYRLSR